MEQKLFEQFEEYLVGSGFVIGDVIPSEIELAEKLGVSHGKAREVVQHYAQLGLLKRVKKRGTILQRLNEEELNRSFSFCLKMGGFYFEELKETRLLLETAILPYILQRLTPVMLEKLEANIKEQQEHINDQGQFEKLDHRFHNLLIVCCQNRVLTLFANILALLFEKRYRNRFLEREWREISLTNHIKILDALKKGDLETLRELIIDHINPT